MHLNITATSSCKAMCVYCPQDRFTSAMEGQPRHLSCREFVELLPALAGTRFEVVSFGGFTEPFDNPEIVELIAIASQQTFVDRIHIYTNGEALTPSIAEALQQVRLGYADISCHGFDAGTYRRTRPFLDAARIRENVLFLLQNRRNIDRLTISVTGPFGSPASLAELETLCSKYGAGFERRDLHSRAGLLHIGRESKVVKSGPFRCAKFDFGKPVLVPGGDLVLCCQDFALEHVIGNLHRQTFEEILRDSPVRKRVLETAAGLREDPNLNCYHCCFCLPVTQETITTAVEYSE
jgi:uncharacterized Fe-S cluster-containing radical SAM superfamily protein